KAPPAVPTSAALVLGAAEVPPDCVLARKSASAHIPQRTLAAYESLWGGVAKRAEAPPARFDRCPVRAPAYPPPATIPGTPAAQGSSAQPPATLYNGVSPPAAVPATPSLPALRRFAAKGLTLRGDEGLWSWLDAAW